MRLFLTILAACSAAVFASSAGAQTSYWDFQDWRVAIERFDTGEDNRVNCTAWTGGDGEPAFRIEISNGDVRPPDFYPAAELHENAPRGYQTVLQNRQKVVFEFDTYRTNNGSVFANRDDEGFAHAVARTRQHDNLAMLRTMRHAGTMWAVVEGDVVFAASLRGFTDAYGKIAEQCGFSPTPPPKSTNPKRQALILARVSRITYAKLTKDVATHFPKNRRIGKTSIHAWAQKLKPKPQLYHRISPEPFGLIVGYSSWAGIKPTVTTHLS